MNIGNVMDALGAAVDTIPGVRVFPYWADRITPPAAVVGWPDPINYDATYARGSDQMTIPMTIVVGRIDARSARDDLSRFLDGSGAASIKTVVDGHITTVWDSAQVQSATVTVVSVAGVEYLGAEFQIDIFGSGG